MGKKNRNAGTTDESTEVDVTLGGAGAESGAEVNAGELDQPLSAELVVSQGPVVEGEEGLVGDESDGKPVDFESLAETPTPFEPANASDLHQEAVAAQADLEQGTEVTVGIQDLGEVIELPVEDSERPEEPDDDTTADEELVHAAEHLDSVSPEAGSDLRTELTGHLPDSAIASWPEEYLILYKRTGKYPDLTKRGNLPVDIRRGGNLRDWKGSELEDWLDGFIRTPTDVEPELIQAEIFKRWKLPGNWSLDAAKAYIFKGEKPEYTKSGVLIDDATRANSPVAHWSYKDLRAALLGEIESKFTKEELVAQLRKRLGLNESFSETALLKDLDSLPEVSMDNVILKAKLEEYKIALSKNPQYLTEETAGKAQKMLYDAIRKVMKRDPADFTEGWLILLNFINAEYNTLFYPERARIGWSRVGLNKTALSTFEDLLTLMIFSREPRTRKAAAQIYKPEQILRHVPDERERQNVINFYAQ